MILCVGLAALFLCESEFTKEDFLSHYESDKTSFKGENWHYKTYKDIICLNYLQEEMVQIEHLRNSLLIDEVQHENEPRPSLCLVVTVINHKQPI